MTAASGTIRAGIGGWTFEPWEGTFYPDGLAKRRQLEYASRRIPPIEVNGTYYSTFKPSVYASWAAETPGASASSRRGRPRAAAGSASIRASCPPPMTATVGALTGRWRRARRPAARRSGNPAEDGRARRVRLFHP